MAVTLEQLLDKIADELIKSDIVTPAVVNQNQKTIREGTLQIGRDSDDKLVLYQKDVEANKKDLLFTTTTNEGDEISILQNLANQVENINQVTINIGIYDGSYTISIGGGGIAEGTSISFITNTDSDNPLNISQFIPLQQSSSIVNVEQAEEFLDTNIYELLPTADTRQARIIRFFQELNALLPPSSPEFDLDGDTRVDRAQDGTWENATQYSQNNSISYAQENTDGTIDEEDAFIHRLKDTANDTNFNRTIQDIYDRVIPYLTDILEPEIEPQDDRPEYTNQSSGYLQFRNLNQGIIIRNTTKEFIDGLDPNNPTWLDDGFTITMWVRFLDKTSEGTLFNFGNPTNAGDMGTPFGFRLETYILNKNDGGDDTSPYNNWEEASLDNQYRETVFETDTSARFVRLVVNEGNDILRDSHVGSKRFDPEAEATGNEWFKKLYTQIPLNEISPYGIISPLLLLNTTFIPMDFTEWYFICATYNPNIDEDGSHDIVVGSGESYGNEVLQKTPDYWMNHIYPDQEDIQASSAFTNNSGYGNRCKVEIISRTDLLRARGFKV